MARILEFMVHNMGQLLGPQLNDRVLHEIHRAINYQNRDRDIVETVNDCPVGQGDATVARGKMKLNWWVSSIELGLNGPTFAY